MKKKSLRSIYRKARLRLKSLLGKDVWIPVTQKAPIEHHGSLSCGWPVLRGSIDANSVIYSFGVGEDASFDLSLIREYGCRILAFDPTPKALEYVRREIDDERFEIYPLALADYNGTLDLFLPTKESHVSASLVVSERTKGGKFVTDCATLRELMTRNGHRQIDVLKVDIEGAEYRAIGSTESLAVLSGVHQLLLEFHHWMPPFSVRDTVALCSKLRHAGFEVAWTSSLGHEVLFVNRNWAAQSSGRS